MKRLTIKKEPEYVYLPRLRSPQSYTFVWMALIVVCCLAAASLVLGLLALSL